MPNYKDYTLGKGQLFFDDGTGELYFGNTPGFTLTTESESLDHFDSDEGIRVKDRSVTLEVNRTGSISTDNMSVENLQKWLIATVTDVSQAATPVANEAISDVLQGRWYQLGKTTNNPQGVRGVGSVVVTVGASTATVAGTDYTLDADNGRIYIIEGGIVITDGSDLQVDYTPVANTRKSVRTNNSASLSGSLRFISKNPEGPQRTWYMPLVTLRPEGELALKGEDWATMTFAVEVGAPTGQSAIYCDGVPVAA